MKRSWFSGLRARFVVLVFLAVLPALGLLLYTASDQRRLAVSEAEQELVRLARLASADQGRLIEGTRQFLVVLARLPEVRAADPACAAFLADLLARFPFYANLGTIAPDGALVCSAVPPPEPTNLADRAYFRNAIETQDFAIGEYQIGRITGKATLNAGYPILAADRVEGVVFAALDLAWLNQFAAQARLPPESVLTVLDRRGTVLIRYPDPEPWVGRSLAGNPVVETILGGGTDVTEGRGEDGGTFLYAFAPLAGAGPEASAYLSIAIPERSTVAEADRRFRRNLAGLGLAGVLALVAAWVGGDVFARKDTDALKTVVRRFYAAFGTGDLALLHEVVAPEYVDRTPAPGQEPGAAGLDQAVVAFRDAFPDGGLVVDDLVAEGDQVVARVTLHGTQTGEFFGVPPTGEAMTAEGIETFRLVGGRIVESWSLFGALRPAPDAASLPDEAGDRAPA